MNRIDFGNIIRELRNERKMTQEELAFGANVAVSQVGRIERGEINPGLSMILSLSEALDIKPHQLFLIDESPNAKNSDLQRIFDALTSIYSMNNTEVNIANTPNSVDAIIQSIRNISSDLHDATISRKVFEQVIEYCGMGYWEIDTKNETVRLCQNILKLIDLAESEYSYKEVSNFLHAIDPKDIDNILFSLRNGSPLVEVDHNIKLKHELVEARSFVIMDTLNHNKIIGVSRIINDTNLRDNVDNKEKPTIISKMIIQETLSSLSEDVLLPLNELQNLIVKLDENDVLKKDQLTHALNEVAEYFEQVQKHLDYMNKRLEQVN